MAYRKVNDEVYYVDGAVSMLGPADLEFLQDRAGENSRRRSRLCMHTGPQEIVQEMFIVHPRGAYVRPHKHLGKPESFLVIDGDVDVVLFDDAGRVTRMVPMGPFASGKMFYYRLQEPVYHTLIIRSEYLFFKEVTSGPFKREENVFAPWAPGEDDIPGLNVFMDRLIKEKRNE